MKEINRENYEVFAIDYIEGNLSVEMHELFEIFLIENPDIAEELDLLPTLSTPDPSKINKELIALKKGAMLSDPISAENCDLYFTAYNEGDLSSSEQAQVNQFLEENPEKVADFKQIGLLHFTADKSVVYPNKKALKKAIPLIPIYQLRKIAAIFVVLFGIGIILFALTRKEALYSERKSLPTLPIEKEVEEINLPEQDSKPIQVAEKKMQPKSRAIQKVQESTPIKTESIIKEETLVAEQKPEIEEQAIENALVSKVDEINEALNKNPEIKDIDIEDQALVAEEKTGDNETLIKFKRPFKSQNNEDELLASKDEATLIKIANPFKNSHKKDLSIGPIKVTRK
jgi:hypothetical protein